MPFLAEPADFRKPRQNLPDESEPPTAAQQIGAAFQIENVIGSYMRDAGDPGLADYDPAFDPSSHLTPEEQPIASMFADANRPEDIETIRTQIAREREARQVMVEGPLPELLASTVAVLADPTTFLPGVGAAYKGGRLSAKIGAAAVGGAADVAISEGALQATQRERTLEESAYSVLLGGAFGMGIGAGAAAITARRAIADGVMDATALSTSMRSMDPDSVGAARAPVVDPEMSKLEDSGVNAMLDKMSRYNLAPVSIQMKSSELESVRRITDELVTTSMVTKGNVQGIATSPSVELKIKRHDAIKASAGQASKALHREHKAAGGGMGYTDFRKEVGHAMRRGDQHADASVAKAAQWMRANVFDPLKDRAVQAGLLPKNVEVKEAMSYFSRVYNREKIKARRPDFKRRIVDWLTRQQQADYQKQQELLAERQAKKQSLDANLEDEIRTEAISSSDATGLREELDQFQFSSKPGDDKLQAFDELDRARGNVAAVDEDIASVREKAGRVSSAINALTGLVNRLDISDERLAGQIGELSELRDIRRGLREDVKAGKKAEREARARIDLPSQTVITRNGKKLTHRGPMDIVTWIRSQGGLQDSGGELKARDLDTFKRKDVAHIGRENAYGPMVDNDAGMRLDDAALRATEAGYFPGMERASIDDLLDAIDRTLRADNDFGGRVWKEEDYDLISRLDEQSRLADEGQDFSLAEAEIARMSDEIRLVQRDLGKQRQFVDALGPAGGKYEKFVDQLDEMESVLDDLQAKRADLKKREGDLESALKETSKASKKTVSDEYAEFAALRKATQQAERAQAKAARQISKLERSAAAVERAIARTNNKIIKIETDDVLEDAADQIIDKILGNNAARTDFFPEPLARGPLKERTFHIPDALIEDYLESDVMEVAMRYITTMAGDIEMTRAFGRADMEFQKIEIQNEANRLIEAAATEKDRIRLQNEATKQIKNIEDMSALLRNRYVSWGDHIGLKRIGRSIKAYNYMRLLGSATLSSVVDAGKIVMEHGLARSFGVLFSDMAAGFKVIRMARKEARLAGTALDIVLATRARSLADLGERYVSESKFERGLSRASDYFGIVNGLSIWTEGMKSWASAMASSKILAAAEKLAKGQNLTRSDRLKLARSGIEEGLARKIAMQADKWERHAGGVILANTEAWDDAVAREAFRDALVAEVDRTVITPGVSDAPVWFHGPVGGLISQFKRFAMASTTQLLASGLQTRDLATLNGVLVMVALGAVGTALRDLTKDGEVKERPTNEWIVNGIDRSGVLSLFVEMDAISDKLTGGHGLMNMIAGKEPQRFQSRGFAGQLAGPTFGMLDDLQKATTAFFDGEATRKDVDRVVTMFPGQNVFWFRNIVEQAKDASGLPANN